MSEIAAALGRALAAQVGAEPVSWSPVGGGDVARAYRVELDDGRTVFAKTHDHPPPGFFATEAAGLSWLADAEADRGTAPPAVPAVLAVSDDPPLLALEWIDEGRSAVSTADTEAAFGRSLATLHRSGASTFGREDRRPTGSRQLPNDPTDTWAEFYAARRLLPLADLAERSGSLAPGVVADLRRVADRLEDLGGPAELPARLHGDLWAGNRLVDVHGVSWLIDPAAHGGHREFDLAMMRLFGGFGSAAFDAYDEVFPLSPGWSERVELHQLAPLVVHAIKFGGAYVGAAASAIRRYA